MVRSVALFSLVQPLHQEEQLYPVIFGKEIGRAKSLGFGPGFGAVVPGQKNEWCAVVSLSGHFQGSQTAETSNAGVRQDQVEPAPAQRGRKSLFVLDARDLAGDGCRIKGPRNLLGIPQVVFQVKDAQRRGLSVGIG